MDTKTLVVGQEVSIFGCGTFKGKVVRTIPVGVEVESFGLLAQFDNEGKETEGSLYRRVGVGFSGLGPEWQPWELVEEAHECNNTDHQHSTYESACNCKLR